MATSEALEELESIARRGQARLGADLARAARDAQDALADGGEALQDALNQTSHRVRRRATHAAQAVSDNVRLHPLLAISAAAAGGALLALALARAQRLRPSA